MAQIFGKQRYFIGCSLLTRVRQVSPGQSKQGIPTPGLAKDSDPPRSQHSLDFPGSVGQFQMMQNGDSPDCIQGRIGQGQPGTICQDAIDGEAVGLRPHDCFMDIASGEIESYDFGTQISQACRHHAVTAAKIQNTFACDVSQPG